MVVVILIEDAPSTIRKFFIGKGNLRSAEAKAAVNIQAQREGLIAKGNTDLNASDAVAGFAYIRATYCGMIPNELVLFGGH